MVPLSLWFGYKFNCWKVAEIVRATFQVNRLAAILFVLAICKNSKQLYRHFFIDLFFHVNFFYFVGVLFVLNYGTGLAKKQLNHSQPMKRTS